MVCQRCSVFNEDGDQFCGNCGAVLSPGRSPANRAPVSPALPYDHAMNAPTLAQPLSPAQSPQYVSPPTQYVPPEHSPSVGWAASQGSYSHPPQATWADMSLNQPASAAPSSAPQRLSASRKRRRWPLYLLLFLVIFGLVVCGSWVFLLRPAIHQSVDGQIRQGLQQAVDQIPGLPPGVPSGRSFPVATEGQIDDYLAQNINQLAPITNMQVSLQPDVMVATFQAYGFGSTVSLGLAVQNGTLVAQNVHVSGLLSWVESSDDLTARFDEALSQVPGKLGRHLAAVSIQEGEIDFTFASS